MKMCSKCKDSKSLSEFGKRSSNKDGYNYYCKACERATSQSYRDSHRDKANKSASDSRKRLPWHTRLFRGTRSSAATRNLEHTITEQDILDLWEHQSGRCYWLGIQMTEDYVGSRHPASPSLDRLDNSKGYTQDNVVLTSTFANLGRSNTTVEDFSAFIKLLRPDDEV